MSSVVGRSLVWLPSAPTPGLVAFDPRSLKDARAVVDPVVVPDDSDPVVPSTGDPVDPTSPDPESPGDTPTPVDPSDPDPENSAAPADDDPVNPATVAPSAPNPTAADPEPTEATPKSTEAAAQPSASPPAQPAGQDPSLGGGTDDGFVHDGTTPGEEGGGISGDSGPVNDDGGFNDETPVAPPADWTGFTDANLPDNARAGLEAAITGNIQDKEAPPISECYLPAMINGGKGSPVSKWYKFLPSKFVDTDIAIPTVVNTPGGGGSFRQFMIKSNTDPQAASGEVAKPELNLIVGEGAVSKDGKTLIAAYSFGE